MIKSILRLFISLSLLFSLISSRVLYSSRDLTLRFGPDVYIDGSNAKTIFFGGERAALCTVVIGAFAKPFFLDADGCRYSSNSRGEKIVCTSDRLVCKTKRELIDFASSEDSSAKFTPRPSWCRSNNLNITERSICEHPYLCKLDLEMSELYKRSTQVQKSLFQKRWLLQQRNSCNADIECLERVYTRRIEELRSTVGATLNDDTIDETKLFVEKRDKHLILERVIIPKSAYIKKSAYDMKIALIVWDISGRSEANWKVENLIGGLHFKNNIKGITTQCYGKDGLSFCGVEIGAKDLVYVRVKDLIFIDR